MTVAQAGGAVDGHLPDMEKVSGSIPGEEDEVTTTNGKKNETLIKVSDPSPISLVL